MTRTKPAIHGRDHARGGADPIPFNASFYPMPQPGEIVLPVHGNIGPTSITELGIVRFPGGVICAAARNFRNSLAGIEDTTEYNPTDSKFSGPHAKAVRSDEVNATVTAVNPCVSFRPVADLGADETRKYIIILGFRAHASATNPKMVIKCPGKGWASDVLWQRGQVGANIGKATWYGWAAMGFGSLSGYETAFTSQDTVDVLAACSGGTANIWIDWIMLMPFSSDPTIGSDLTADDTPWYSYYFQSGQGQNSPPPGTDSFPSDVMANQFENVLASSQRRDSPADTNMTLTDGGEGQINSTQQDMNTLYAIYTFARTHKAGVDYHASRYPYDSGRLTWWKNTQPAVTARVPADGAWRPYFMGLYNPGFDEMGLSLWTTTNKYEQYANAGGGGAPADNVRVQDTFYVPVRQGLDLLPF